MMYRFLLALLAAGLPALAMAQLLSPSEFLPHEHGEQFTPHHLVVAYARHVADNSPRVQLQEYGATPEGRPLILLTISSEENLARIQDIRTANLQRAGMLPGTPAPELNQPVVWLSFGVHGNEAGGTESSMSTLYELAREDRADIKEWLSSTVVLLDPSLNPDGYDRYTQWYRRVAPKANTPEPHTLEHQEPWPGGRVNHYLFDLNRDWAWQTQPESRQRLALYQQWLPHVHVDVHEQYPDNPYYFAPAAAPYHEHITDWQAEFQMKAGQNHASHFDKQGWLYFTREVFDLLYPSYGDTYPTFNGSIGMTHEQAGHGISGRGILMENGDTLTLQDRIDHHTVAALSTVEVAYNNREKLLSSFSAYFKKAAEGTVGQFQSFVISKDNPQGKIKPLLDLLDRNQIRYGTATQAREIKGYDYRTGGNGSYQVKEGDLVIPSAQPMSTLVQVLFEPEPALEDSLTYDITAWALPFAYGLKAVASDTKVPQAEGFTLAPLVSNTNGNSQPAYAYLYPWQSFSDARFLSAAMQAGLKPRLATGRFELEGQAYPAGSIAFTRADNRKLGEAFDTRILALAEKHQQPITPVYTGFSDSGFDLGSESMSFIDMPKTALLTGPSTNANSFGEAWHYFEQSLDYPVFLISAEDISSEVLSHYDVVVMPEGRYAFSESQQGALGEWMRRGGRVIAIGRAVGAFAGQQGFSLATKRPEQKEAAAGQRLLPYAGQARRSITNYVPGAIFKTQLDITHPLAFGLGSHYYSLKTSSSAFELLERGWNAGYLSEAATPIGFAGAKAVENLKGSLVFGIENQGRGGVVYLVDNPLFRGFWEEGKLLFANALFFSQN